MRRDGLRVHVMHLFLERSKPERMLLKVPDDEDLPLAPHDLAE